ncbi:MAG: hypothetical protein H7644_11490 [Candidatus Heimdallarchaeota archaeon]|nr:hypothetical protein [Candidatus Heimdallarchaeota archaeon]MCK5144384.1 hypothetical protein [Candidatus Heimdallarchaeota archaeon]
MLPGTLSIIFFGIEFFILVAVIIFNRKHPFFWSIASVLILLQLYQLAEFLICIGVNENITGRIAYTIITFLPPLGYFLSSKVVGWRYPDYWIGFAAATGFSLYYLVTPGSVALESCNPFYAIYSIHHSLYYGIYYVGIIVYSIIFLVAHLLFRRNNFDRKSSLFVLIGYLSFLAPMYIMVWVDSYFARTVTSMMCKYALVLAVILGVFSFIKPKIKGDQVEEKIAEI